jgi:hypothetical protein
VKIAHKFHQTLGVPLRHGTTADQTNHHANRTSARGETNTTLEGVGGENQQRTRAYEKMQFYYQN